jgi:spore coat polysaccharide biosynthesis protein SpsF
MIRPFYKGQSMIELIIDRFISELNKTIPFVIATTNNPFDNEIENISRRMNVNFYRGSENDVLDRFIKAAEKFNFENVIRVCADNPLFDLKGTIELTSVPHADEFDYIGYKISGDIPTILTHSGFWGEVVSLKALKQTHHETSETVYMEHVTNYIYKHPQKFRIKLVEAPDYLYFRNDIRLTVDTKEDFELMQEIYNQMMARKISIEPERIIQFIDVHPDFLVRMNHQIELNRKV